MRKLKSSSRAKAGVQWPASDLRTVWLEFFDSVKKMLDCEHGIILAARHSLNMYMSTAKSLYLQDIRRMRNSSQQPLDHIGETAWP